MGPGNARRPSMPGSSRRYVVPHPSSYQRDERSIGPATPHGRVARARAHGLHGVIHFCVAAALLGVYTFWLRGILALHHPPWFRAPRWSEVRRA